MNFKNLISIIEKVSKGKTKEDFLKWKEENKDKIESIFKKYPDVLSLLRKYPFRLKQVTYGGGPVRQTPHEDFYLLIKENWIVYRYDFLANPLYEDIVSVRERQKINEKWFDYEGLIGPNNIFNPTKELKAEMITVDKGTVDIKEETEERGAKKFKMDFDGKDLKGIYYLEQESEKADIWVFSKGKEFLSSEIDFVIQEHKGKNLEKHWDLRFDINDHLDKWTFVVNPVEIKEIEKPVRVVRSVCKDKSWMDKEGKVTLPRWGETEVKIIDKGKANIIESNPRFLSVIFNGKHLKGYYVFQLRNGSFVFEKSKLPEPKKLKATFPEGHPQGKPFKSKIEENDDKIVFILRDIRFFSSCEKFDYPGQLPKDVKAIVCSYPVEGSLPHLKIQRIEFKKPAWSLDKAKLIIKEEDFSSWEIEEPRPKKKNQLDALWACPIFQEMLQQYIDLASHGNPIYEYFKSGILTEELSQNGFSRKIKGIALMEGTFNGAFYPAEEIEKSYKTLLGKPFMINHSKDVRDNIGKITKVWWEPKEKSMYFEAEIDNEEFYSKIKEGKLTGVSVGVLTNKMIRGRKIVATDLIFKELSLVVIPACPDCQIKFVEGN